MVKTYKQVLLSVVIILGIVLLWMPSGAQAISNATGYLGSAQFELQAISEKHQVNTDTVYRLKIISGKLPESSSLRLEAAMPQANSGEHAAHGGGGGSDPIEASFSPSEGNGVYEARINYPMAGDWQAKIVADNGTIPLTYFFNESIQDSPNWLAGANTTAILLLLAFIGFRGDRQIRDSRKSPGKERIA